MSEEESKAIYRLNFYKEGAGLGNGTVVVNKFDLETVLNMLDKQDKIIRAMAEEILIKRTWVLNEEEIEEDKDSIIREYEDKVENEIYI